MIFGGIEAHQGIGARLEWVSGRRGVLIGPSRASYEASAVLSIVDAVVGCSGAGGRHGIKMSSWEEVQTHSTWGPLRKSCVLPLPLNETVHKASLDG